MEKLTLKNMIKALRCVASQDTTGKCYGDYENLNHMQDEGYKRIVCREVENLKDYVSGENVVTCPYYQKDYGCCFEDGELFWLEDVAELLEKQIPQKPKNMKSILDFSGNYYTSKGDCPNCGAKGLYRSNSYCNKCGQALDWGEHQKRIRVL